MSYFCKCYDHFKRIHTVLHILYTYCTVYTVNILSTYSTAYTVYILNCIYSKYTVNILYCIYCIHTVLCILHAVLGEGEGAVTFSLSVNKWKHPVFA